LKVIIVVMIASVPLTYRGKNVGKVVIEVYFAGISGYGQGPLGGVPSGYGQILGGTEVYQARMGSGYPMRGYPPMMRGYVQPGLRF
jgi:hypothetical protein